MNATDQIVESYFDFLDRKGWRAKSSHVQLVAHLYVRGKAIAWSLDLEASDL